MGVRFVNGWTTLASSSQYGYCQDQPERVVDQRLALEQQVQTLQAQIRKLEDLICRPCACAWPTPLDCTDPGGAASCAPSW